MKKILLPILLIGSTFFISCEKEIEDKVVKIEFDTDGGSAVDPIYVKQGRALEKDMEPTPTKSGFEVSGWTALNGALKVTFDEKFYVTDNMTLKATWTMASTGGSDPVALGSVKVSGTCGTTSCHPNYATRFKGDNGATTVIDNIGVSGSHANRATAFSDAEKTNAKAYINSL